MVHKCAEPSHLQLGVKKTRNKKLSEVTSAAWMVVTIGQQFEVRCLFSRPRATLIAEPSRAGLVEVCLAPAATASPRSWMEMHILRPHP